MSWKIPNLATMGKREKWNLINKILESDSSLKHDVAEELLKEKGAEEAVSKRKTNSTTHSVSNEQDISSDKSISPPPEAEAADFGLFSVDRIELNVTESIRERSNKPASVAGLFRVEHFWATPKELEELSIEKLNEAAAVGLKLCEKKQNGKWQREIVSYFWPLTDRVGELCRGLAIQCFDDQKQNVDKEVRLPKVFKEHFERVLVKGDGNCLWHSVSISLFGDYGATEALRLLTAATLIEFEREFRGRFDEQETKFGYKPDVTYDQLLATSTQLGVWGDEYHAMALSMAVRRPINSYGDFDQAQSMTLQVDAEGSKYEMAKAVYESNDLISHYRYVGFEEDDCDDKEPVCIFYDGQFHYSVILPRNVEGRPKPWKPKTQLLEYMIPKKAFKKESSAIVASKTAEEKDKVMSIGSYSDKNSHRSSKTNDSIRKASFKQRQQIFEQSNDQKTPAPDQELRKKHIRAVGRASHCHLCKERTSDLVLLDCSHGCCYECVGEYLQPEHTMGEGMASFKCPKIDCNRKVSTELVSSATEDDQEMTSSTTSCPQCKKECQQDVRLCTCEECGFVFCGKCQEAYHGSEHCDAKRHAVKKNRSKNKLKKEEKEMEKNEGQDEEMETEVQREGKSEFKTDFICETCDNSLEIYKEKEKAIFFNCSSCDNNFKLKRKVMLEAYRKTQGEGENCQIVLGSKYIINKTD